MPCCREDDPGAREQQESVVPAPSRRKGSPRPSSVAARWESCRTAVGSQKVQRSENRVPAPDFTEVSKISEAFLLPDFLLRTRVPLTMWCNLSKVSSIG